MTEAALQVAVAHMLQVVLDPEKVFWSALDHGAGKLSKRAAGMMKARGVRRGLPDFIIMYGPPVQRVIGVELKTDKGRLTEDQREVAAAWLKMGQAIYVARSLEEVQEILDHCRVPMRTRMKFLEKAR